MTLQEQGATWIRVEVLEALLLSGAPLPTEATLNILNPEIEHIRAQGVYDSNSAWSLVRCLGLLPFVQEPAIGIERIRQVISETPLWDSALRDLFGALGSSRCREALDLLTQLAGPDGSRMPEAFEEWIDAVATLSGPESTRILLSFIDSEVEGFDIPTDTARHGEGEVVVSRIVDLARLDPKVMQRIVRWCDASLPPARRLLLTKVINRLGTVEAVLAGLNLIDESSTPSVPYELRAALENVFLERRPSGTTGSSYTLEPRSSNEIRAKLFEMAFADVRRKQSASALLEQIEVWRLEYGRPSGEPRHPGFDSRQPWPPIYRAT